MKCHKKDVLLDLCSRFIYAKQGATAAAQRPAAAIEPQVCQRQRRNIDAPECLQWSRKSKNNGCAYNCRMGYSNGVARVL